MCFRLAVSSKLCVALDFELMHSFMVVFQGVKPLVENILKSDLDRFAVYAKKESAKKTIPQK